MLKALVTFGGNLLIFFSGIDSKMSSVIEFLPM